MFVTIPCSRNPHLGVEVENMFLAVVDHHLAGDGVYNLFLPGGRGLRSTDSKSTPF